MSANDAQAERHKQNQNTKHSSFEPRFRESRGETGSKHGNATQPSTTGFPLGLILRACPDITMYAKDGIGSWRDLCKTAGLVRSALGVSPDAWAQAVEALGEIDASICIAAILQKAEAVRSAGGYLRVLTEKGRAGEFSVGPMLMALLKSAAKNTGQSRAG